MTDHQKLLCAILRHADAHDPRGVDRTPEALTPLEVMAVLGLRRRTGEAS